MPLSLTAGKSATAPSVRCMTSFRPIMSFLCLGLSFADPASWAGPVASGQSRRPLDLVPSPATFLCARGGKEVFRAHADRLSHQTTAAFNYRDLFAGGTASGRQRPPCRGRYSPTHHWVQSTGLDTTMLVFTGSRERTESEYQDLLHRAGLTPVLGADGHAAIVATFSL
jgi:hypothetical protein